jgi:hypothetical protein
MTWRLHIDRIVAKVWHTYLRTYSLFKSEHLSTDIKLPLYKILIRSIMTYACPTWEYAADTNLLKLQCLQNRVLQTTENFERCTLFCKMYVPFQFPYVYNMSKTSAILPAELP